MKSASCAGARSVIWTPKPLARSKNVPSSGRWLRNAAAEDASDELVCCSLRCLVPRGFAGGQSGCGAAGCETSASVCSSKELNPARCETGYRVGEVDDSDGTRHGLTDCFQQTVKDPRKMKLQDIFQEGGRNGRITWVREHGIISATPQVLAAFETRLQFGFASTPLPSSTTDWARQAAAPATARHRPAPGAAAAAARWGRLHPTRVVRWLQPLHKVFPTQCRRPTPLGSLAGQGLA